MATFGRIEEFSEEKGNSWQEYAERLECFFTANDIEEESKKTAVLLSVCGAATYSTLRSLLAPTLPTQAKYKDIVDCLHKHYNPPPSPIVQRFHFHNCIQKPDQSIASYLAELRKLSVYCEFGEQLENMLRDRVVCGVRDVNLQRRLLAEPKLTFSMAEEKALAAETASANVRALHPDVTPDSADIHVTVQQQRRLKKTPEDVGESRKPCFRCGGTHSSAVCKFTSAICHYCKKRGHIARACMSKSRANASSSATNTVMVQPQQDENVHDDADGAYTIYSVVGQHDKKTPFYATVIIDKKQLKMEVDSGAACSLISEDTFHSLWPTHAPQLLSEDRVLRQWTSTPLSTLGKIVVNVEYHGATHSLPLLVIQGHGTSLLGRDWFGALGIDVSGVYQVRQHMPLSILEKHAEVFGEKLGAYRGPPVSIDVDASVSPKFFKARAVPFALRTKMDEALDLLVEQGVFTPVKHSRWATPIVPVVKKDGSLRLCGDYRCTVNTAVKPDVYPLPTVSEIFAQLAGGTVFTKLDLKQAYQQLCVDEQAAELLTINTHRGLFRALRLQFGVSTAVSIFQRFMDTLLAGIPGVQPYLDDVLLTGRTQGEHDQHLDEVLQRLAEAGLRLQKEKCSFGVTEVEFLGFRIDKDGIRPTTEKVAAIQGAPAPRNKTELQAFLGLLNFYNCFLRNKATVLEPLHRLLDQSAAWKWTSEHATAYMKAKQLLQTDDVLVHYNEAKPLVLVCDASPYGLGALLSHVQPDGREAPVCFASRTMTSTERNYAQIDKEALAIIFAVRKFHQYLFGRPFIVYTDHKPLLGLLHHSKPMPQVLSPRMLRWSLILSAYQYELCYRPGKQLANADALSRLPLPAPLAETPPPFEVLLLEATPDPPLQADRIAELTTKDPVLSRVLRWTLHGWPACNTDKQFSPFFVRRHEMSVHKNCVLWGNRVVIPEQARKEVLVLLHDAHPGIVRMKGLARSYVWWPGLDAQVEETVRRCLTCQQTRHAPPKAPVHSWECSSRRWSRLHIDFAGPFHGKVFLIVVDSYSKWLEVELVSAMSSAAVIIVLRKLMATHGIPDVIVSDNGTAFTSAEFKRFMQRNGIRHTTSAPYHPSTNGQAERMVQTTKESLERITQGDWPARLARFLLAQHTTPHAVTQKSPAELLMGRRLITALDRLHPDFVGDSLQKQREAAAVGPKPVRQFEMRGPVFLRNFGEGPRWMPGEIVDITGPLSYKVRAEDGQVHRRHVDQLRGRLPSSNARRFEPISVDLGDSQSLPADSESGHEPVDHRPTETMPTPLSTPTETLPTAPSTPSPETLAPTVSPASAPHQRPVRLRVPPRRYQDFE
ncbi:hypothetical protein ACEWY4_017838 [Coilia grayii]|uniref:Gypsy retrotransposon integrase-like protein 1 n=1 Tax=Coilia grayii TaxID=363190 RepID=A0ABD1JHZ1_9TELE